MYSSQRLCDSSSVTSNHGDDSQNSLATIITQLLIKEIITYTYAEAYVLFFIQFNNNIIYINSTMTVSNKWERNKPAKVILT